MAAKKAIVSSESAILSAPPPPGRTMSASATTATSPNFAAVFTAMSVAALADRAGGNQDQHDAAQHDAIGDEHDYRVRHQIAQQEGDRGVADDEGEERRHHQAAYRAARGARVPELEQPAEHHGRDRQQEREARRAG